MLSLKGMQSERLFCGRELQTTTAAEDGDGNQSRGQADPPGIKQKIVAKS